MAGIISTPPRRSNTNVCLNLPQPCKYIGAGLETGRFGVLTEGGVAVKIRALLRSLRAVRQAQEHLVAVDRVQAVAQVLRVEADRERLAVERHRQRLAGLADLFSKKEDENG